MRRRCRHLVVATAAAVVLLAFPGASWAAGEFVATATLSKHTATTESPLLASVDFGGLTFGSIDTVCLNFTFEGDLLDPGDELAITALDHSPVVGAGGFTNVFQAPQPGRTLCIPNDGLHGEFPQLFFDGHESRIEIAMWRGSVNISELSVTLIGAAIVSAPTQTVTLTFRGENGRTVVWSGDVSGGVLDATYRPDGVLAGLHGACQLAGGISLTTDFDWRNVGRLMLGSLTATRGAQRISVRNIVGLASADGIDLATRAQYFDGRNTTFGDLSIRIAVTTAA